MENFNLRLGYLNGNLRRGAILIFILLTTYAMFLYPGGNIDNPNASTYDFWRNVLSDLGTTITIRNEDNMNSAILFTFAMEILGITSIISWKQITERNSFYTKTHQFLGILSGIGMCGVGITPYNILPNWHGFCVGLFLIGFSGILYPSNYTQSKLQSVSKYQIYFEKELFWISIFHFGLVLGDLFDFIHSHLFISITQKFVIYGLILYFDLNFVKNVRKC